MVRILLIEDELDLGAEIERLLQREGYEIDRATDGDLGWAFLSSPDLIYDVAIIDWMLPGISGIDLCRRLRQQQQQLPVLMLTARNDIHDRVTGLDAGADDYLAKPFSTIELLARIRALSRRPAQFQSAQIKLGNFSLEVETHTLKHSKSAKISAVTLTRKEYQILECLMTNHGQIVPADRLRDRAWDLATDRASNVLPAQIRLLRKKLSQLPICLEIENIHGIGYRLNSPTSM
ncbi:two-component system response regulator RppA [Chamaesiphon minutus]|uniref:Response regulator with CheY-like receiver domain and winged-helix DNA-binding domain n=1 Tax=Chamaesiphon minutus (strain ATCC 27169 / PCC 6605) TaxID=1173020 RepID=K9UDR2_CHAP6|nr:two-component system response regulator RppA [Chamaesiphon minutus]AFY92970.1 response regulator with CheY-like receiver domain and winged-helix DNA-binding domain [Chamaesiphon minutus PCC 6605]